MPFQLDVHTDECAWHKALAEDVFRGLTSEPKSLPPKYFYDAAGSALFDRITRTPEYYLTRAEHRLVASLATPLLRELRPDEVVELGSGGATKIRWLLEASDGAGAPRRYVPVDVDEETVRAAAAGLVRDYPSLRVHGVIGDFEQDLIHVPAAAGRRLVVFFGSTIGNLDPPARRELLAQVRRLLGPRDRFLLGLDLVKDARVLEAAYNDAAGLTREFNRNILRVVNRALQANFEPEAFRHRAFYNEHDHRIEMHLVATSRQRVHLDRLALTIEMSAGEGIWTESSYKFTRESAHTMLEGAGLTLERWYADADGLFGLALAGPG